MKKSINLLSQIIEYQEHIEKEAKISSYKFSDKIGDSWMLTHLRALRQLIQEEFKTTQEQFNQNVQ